MTTTTNSRQSHTRRAKQPQPKKSNRRKIMLSILLSFLLVLSYLTYFGWTTFTNYKKAAAKIIDTSVPNQIADIHAEPFSVLFIGAGTNGFDGEAPLSDSINLFVINPQNGFAEAIAIPRDSYLPMGQSCGWTAGLFDKVTHASEATCLQETLEQTFDLKINYYVRLDFMGFVQIVDALHGVEMDVPDLRPGFEQFEGDPDDGLYLPPALKNGQQWCESDSHRNAYAICFDTFGPQTVNGEQALALARTRHYDSDYARSLRQSALIKAIIEKATSASGLISANELFVAAGESFSTNIPEEQFLAFADLGNKLFQAKESDNFAIRTTQLQSYPHIFRGETDVRALYAEVSLSSLEHIRWLISQALSPTPSTLNPRALSFTTSPDTTVTAAQSGPFLTPDLDLFDSQDIARFAHPNSLTPTL